MTQAEYRTHWNATERLLTIQLMGVFSSAQVEEWERELVAVSRHIPLNFKFRTLLDNRGYEVGEQDPKVHQLQRVVVPTLLARHGFEAGYFRLFEVQNTIPVSPELAHCTAVAHVHHDQSKMDRYNDSLGCDVERFFTDIEAARNWLLAVG